MTPLFFDRCLQFYIFVISLFAFRRSVSETSISSNVAISNDLDLNSDSVLDAIGKKMERIDLSVGDPTQYYIG